MYLIYLSHCHADLSFPLQQLSICMHPKYLISKHLMFKNRHFCRLRGEEPKRTKAERVFIKIIVHRNQLLPISNYSSLSSHMIYIMNPYSTLILKPSPQTVLQCISISLLPVLISSPQSYSHQSINQVCNNIR